MAAASITVLSLNDPLVRAILLPLGATAIAIAVIRLACGEGRGAILANAGVGVGLLTGVIAIFGLSPASDLMAKAAWATIAGTLIGAAADRFTLALPAATLLLIGWPVLALLWFVAPELKGGSSDAALMRLGGLMVGAVTLFVRLDQEQDRDANAAVLLIWCAIALGGVAHVSGFGVAAELSATIAAALCGYLLWNLPVNRYPIGQAAILAAGTLVIALATLFLRAHPASALALVPLLAIPFADRISPLVARSRRLNALTLSLGAAVPTIAAIGLAFLLR